MRRLITRMIAKNHKSFGKRGAWFMPDSGMVWRQGIGQFFPRAFRVQHSEDIAQTFSKEDLLAAKLRVAKVLPYQQSHPPFISNLSLAIFAGLLLVFAFPDWGLWSLAWVGTSPLIMAIAREQRFWRASLLGLITGTVFYFGTSNWITFSMNQYGGISLWLCYTIALLIAVIMAAFTGLFAGGLALAIRQFGGWAILAAPLLWATSEWLRLLAIGVGWNALGYSQAFQPAVIQLARFGGVYLISGLLVMVSTGLVFALIYLERRRGLVVLTVVGLLALAAVMYGWSVKPEEGRDASLLVTVVQPNVPVDGDWSRPEYTEQMLDSHIRLAEQALQTKAKEVANHDAHIAGRLVVWPESPVSFDYEREADLRRRLAEFTKRNDVYLLFVGWGTDTDKPDALYNSAMLLAPSGERIARYDKIALMPFGEYVPARGWIPFMDRIPALVGDLSVGAQLRLCEVAETKVATPICFEATRPDLLRRMRSEGAMLIVQLSNEAWFGPSAVARQMLAQTVFRAVENGVEVIRSTNSGETARIDRYGTVYDETALFMEDTRVWKVAARQGSQPTLYTRYGEWFVIICTGLSVLLVLAACIHRIKTKEE